MKRNRYIIGITILLSWAFLYDDVVHWDIQPEHFPVMEYDFSQNPLDSQIIQLGRALFYDPILSKDGSISCASCHSPYHAFAHTDHALSHGINDSIGTRNAPALFNLGWQTAFMWDGAIHHLDVQALAPIHSPIEMGETLTSVISKLKASPIYPKYFENAFGDNKITGERILKSLSQFQLTLVSAHSKYDRVSLGMDTFNIQESNGYELFKTHCNDCHTEPLFHNNSFMDNGLAVDTTLNDYGKWIMTKQSIDSLKFKVPSLRNLSYTYPYMHDGRFKKLRQVLNHYSSDISSERKLQVLNGPLQLTSNEKTDIIAFLLTLNDPDFVFDSRHHFPRNILLPREENKD